MSYTPKYSKPYPNGWQDSPSKETPVMAENLNAYDNVLLAIEQYLSSEIGEDYAKLTDAGYSLGLDIDHSTYVMTISLKNKAGEVISSKSIDFPIESMVVDASYSEGILALSLQNGTTLDVDISAIVGGLVADTRKIAGLDLKDDITAEELRNALSVPTKTSELENDSQYITADDIIPEDSVVAKGEIKPWLYDTSGQETIVGVYNQKPLYQKVLFFENVTVGNEMYLNIDLGMGDNIDKIFVHNVHLEDDVGILYDLPFTHPHAENTIGAFLSENGNTLNLRLGSSNYNLTFRLLTIILRYTKTTDAEGSGEELMPYGFVNKNIERLDAINSRLAYKDISSSIDVGDTGCTASGYVENGQVVVRVTLPVETSGNVVLSIAETYTPRTSIGGSLASLSAGGDLGKIMGVMQSDGYISMYVSGSLAAAEMLTFTYPLKTS